MLIKNNSLYIAGEFTFSLEFGLDFGVSALKDAGDQKDIFLLKINLDGDFDWVHHFGSDASLNGIGLTIDNDENIYIGSCFKGSINFTADFPASDNSTFNNSLNNSNDIFISKIKTSGDYLWSYQLGGSGNDCIRDLVLDGSDNLIITGNFEDNLNFGSAWGTYDIKTSNGLYDVFITKIDTNNTYQWTRNFGGINHDVPYKIIHYKNNEMYLAGYFSDEVNFSLNPSITDHKTAYGSTDIFILKFNSAGQYYWTKIFGGTGQDTVNSITADNDGNIYLGGSFFAEVNFGADFNINDLKTSSGSNDAFITSINSDSNYNWTRQFTGTGNSYESINDLLYTKDILYIGGYSQTNINLGQDFSINDYQINQGSYDMWFTKIIP